MLRYLTAGESHGKCLIGVLEGIPAGLKLKADRINEELSRRQSGYGRGSRMKIEKDKVGILSGLRRNTTLGSPIAFIIKNRDYTIDKLPVITRPRPGHADLAGAIKYDQPDIRNVLERASARDTAARVACGAICKTLLKELGIDILSHVIMIAGIRASALGLAFNDIRRAASKSALNCADREAEALMMEKIDEAKGKGDTLGGAFEVVVSGVPAGLGSYVEFDRRLDGRLAQAVMSIQAVKAVEIGTGVKNSAIFGSKVHDNIYYRKDRGFYRKTNNAGGLEGGVSNGEPIIVRGYMKPIATLSSPLASVDVKSKRPIKAAVERHDICAVPACGVVGEAVVAFEIARAAREKFGGDSLGEMKRNYEGYIKQVRNY